MGRAPKGKVKEAVQRKQNRLQKRIRAQQQQQNDIPEEGESMSDSGTTEQGMLHSPPIVFTF